MLLSILLEMPLCNGVCVSEASLLKHASHVSCNAAVLGANEVSSQSTRLLVFAPICAVMAIGLEKGICIGCGSGLALPECGSVS